MRAEWDSIHQDAKSHPGVLATEINPAIGQDAVLIHHIFQDEDALLDYFESTATQHMQDLLSVANRISI